MAVRQNRRRRISNKAPSRRRVLLCPGVLYGIVNRTQVCKCKFVVVIFAAFDNQSAIGQHRRSESIGDVSGWQTRYRLPASLDVAAVDIRSELGPVGLAVALRDDGSVGHQKAYSGAVGRLVNQRLHSLSQQNAGDSKQKNHNRESLFLCHRGPFLSATRRWETGRAGRSS